MNCKDSKVTCIKPAVNSHNFFCQIRAFVIAFHYSRSLNLKDSLLTAFKNITIHINNAGLNTADWRTDCAVNWSRNRANCNDWSCFCKTVTFYNLNSNSPEEFINIFWISSTAGNTCAEVRTKHYLNLAENKKVTQPVKRPHQAPRQDKENPPEKGAVSCKARILIKHFSLHCLMDFCNTNEEIEKFKNKSACFSHLFSNAVVNSFKNTRNGWKQVRIEFFEICQQD